MISRRFPGGCLKKVFGQKMWCLACGILQLVAQPVKPFIQPIPRSCSSHLNVPISVPKTMKTKLVCDLRSIHSIWQILLVGKYEQNLKSNVVYQTDTVPRGRGLKLL